MVFCKPKTIIFRGCEDDGTALPRASAEKISGNGAFPNHTIISSKAGSALQKISGKPKQSFGAGEKKIVIEIQRCHVNDKVL